MATSKAPKEELAAARRIANHAERASALQQLAFSLPQAERIGLLEDARRAVQAISDKPQQVRALQQLAPQMPPAARQAVLREALSIANGIDEPMLRVTSLEALARDLPEAIDATLEALRNLQHGMLRSDALGRIASRPLSPDQLTLAWEITKATKDESFRVHAIGRLLPYLSAQQRSDAAATVRLIIDPASKIKGLLDLARYAHTEREMLLKEAGLAVRDVHDFGQIAKYTIQIANQIYGPAGNRRALAELFALKRIATLTSTKNDEYFHGISDFDEDSALIYNEEMLDKIKSDLVSDINNNKSYYHNNFDEIIKLIDEISISIDIQFVIESKDKLRDLLSRPDDRPTSLPDAPSKLWVARGPGRPKPGWEEGLFAFIREVYGPYFEAGLQNHIRAYIYRHDRPLYDAIKHYERRDRVLPADIAMPTRQEIVEQRFERAKRDGLQSLSGPERHSVVRKLRRGDPNP